MVGGKYEFLQDEAMLNTDGQLHYNGAPNDGSGWCTGPCPENASDPNYDPNNDTVRMLRNQDVYYSYDLMEVRRRSAIWPDAFGGDLGGRLARSIP